MSKHGPRVVVPIDLKKKPSEQKLPLHNRWHPAIPAVAEVCTEELFRVEMVDFSGGGITKEYTAEDIKFADASIVHYLSGPIRVVDKAGEPARPGDLLAVEICNLGPLPGDEWGFTAIFDRENGGGFLTDHFPRATKVIWYFEGIYAYSPHIPGVRFPGLTHPGIVGTAPSMELLSIWNERERKLVETGLQSLKLCEVLHSRPLVNLPSTNGCVLGKIKEGTPEWDRIANEAARTIPGRENGGNCDIKNLSRGSKVYLPVFVDGANLSTGDMHFSQGDGEVAFRGAIEMSGFLDLKCEIIRDGMKRYLTPMGPTPLHVNPIFEIGPVEPRFSEWLVFEGISVDESGRQHYLDASVTYKRTLLNAIDYISRFGYTKEQCRFVSFPRATKVIWYFEGIYAYSPHIPGVRFPGLTHPGIVGTAPSMELLSIWNERERKLVEIGLQSLKLCEVLHSRPLVNLPSTNGCVLGKIKEGTPEWDRIANEAARTIPGRENGGNCDIKNLSRGSKVYLPVFVDGANLSTGDMHFSQGDGEVAFCGAIEMSGFLDLKCEIIRDGMKRYLTPIGPTPLHVNPIFEIGPVEPRFSEWLVFEGISVDESGRQHYLDASVAYKRAVLNAIDYISRFGYTKEQCRFVSFPRATKVIWYFEGIYAYSPHIPGVRFPGLTHPGIVGTAPSMELLSIWNERERKLVETGLQSLKLCEVLHSRPLVNLPSTNGCVLGKIKEGTPEWDRIANEAARTIPGRENGGNCDIKNLSKGSKVYLPVFVDGANLSTGDMHFSQGDGEVAFCGAIEMSGLLDLKCEIIRDGMKRYLTPMGPTPLHVNPIFEIGPVEPRFSEWLVFEGISVDESGRQHYLDASVAYKRVVLNAIDYISRFGYTKEQVYLLLSCCHCEGRISGIVDSPNAVATLAVPIAIFDQDIRPKTSNVPSGPRLVRNPGLLQCSYDGNLPTTQNPSATE